ncbi:hypothetical protein CERZMDRAFT_82613 [Cercospora zeae-maydis SCOH1-5]|uniref:Uncharacterized protein n=1 Tax=Cercospora zeae-maydis SCOH1-5 TaxID=717836 RepID=A0A6A6FMK7_9PEZI|nr:hypothetical protein CERZMDRAFT_82613 [Cercospora zeae-maydis SCOH1-5]
MFSKTLISLLAASATVFAAAVPGDDDKGNAAGKGGQDSGHDADYESGHGSGDYGNSGIKTVTVSVKGNTEWKTKWSTKTITSTSTRRDPPRTITVEADPVTRTVTVNAAPAASTPEILNVRLHPNTGCSSNAVRGDGNQVDYSEVAIAVPASRRGRGDRKSQCYNTPNDFGSLSFEKFFGRKGLDGCTVQVFDDQNCQGGRILRSIGVSNNERECYNVQAGGQPGGQNGGSNNWSNSGSGRGNGDKDGQQNSQQGGQHGKGGSGGSKDGKNQGPGAQSVLLVCKN